MTVGRPTLLKEGAEPIARDHGNDSGDDDDAFQERPIPRQPAQLREYSEDEDDDDGIVKEVYVSSSHGQAILTLKVHYFPLNTFKKPTSSNHSHGNVSLVSALQSQPVYALCLQCRNK